MEKQRESLYNSLPEEQRELASVIGMEAYIKLAEYVNGDQIYIPKLETAQRQARNMAIVEEFNGGNYHELAQKYGLSPRMIRRITQGGNGI